MIVLLESNSLKLCPSRIIAFIDGASSGAIGAECASPTTSSVGTAMLTSAVMSNPAQNDRHREQADHVRNEGAVRALGALVWPSTLGPWRLGP